MLCVCDQSIYPAAFDPTGSWRQLIFSISCPRSAILCKPMRFRAVLVGRATFSLSPYKKKGKRDKRSGKGKETFSPALPYCSRNVQHALIKYAICTSAFPPAAFPLGLWPHI